MQASATPGAQRGVTEGPGKGAPPFCTRWGAAPRLAVTVGRWFVHTVPGSAGTCLSLTLLPPVWAPHRRRETLVISGSLAFYPASHGALIALFTPQPPCASSPPFPDKPCGLTASLCPEDSSLEWHLKGSESSALGRVTGGRAGGRRRRQLDPKPSGEGFTQLLLIMLKADPALLTHNFDQNYMER